MRRIRFGRTEEEVSVVAVGTWSYGGERVAGGRAVGWAGHRDRDAKAALRTAFEGGINHWDTADSYGKGASERLLGSMWKTIPRDQVFLATKVGWMPGSFEGFYHPDLIRQQAEKSLQNLQTDVIDLYYFHHCDFGPRDARLDDAIKIVRDLQQQGKVRFIGLSDWDPHKILRLAPVIDPDVVQPYRNLLDASYVTCGLSAYVREHDLGVAFFSPLRHGVLLGKYAQPPTFPAGDVRSRIPEFADPQKLARFAELATQMQERFSDHPEPVLHALVDSLLADSESASVLLGQRNLAQARAALTLGNELAAREALAIARLYQTVG